MELARVKEALSDYSKNLGSTETLNIVPPILDQIKGSITILNLERAANLLGQCNQYIKHDLIERAIKPDTEALENLADAISSIEYYLESLVGKWGNPETILTIAEKSLAEIIEVAKTAEEGSAQALADVNQPDITIPDSIEATPVDEDTLVDITQLDESELSLEQSIADEDTLTDILLPDFEEQTNDNTAELAELSISVWSSFLKSKIRVLS